MAKKPFSVRIEVDLAKKIRAMAVVRNLELADMFNEMVTLFEDTLTEEQQKTLEMLLKVWTTTPGL